MGLFDNIKKTVSDATKSIKDAASDAKKNIVSTSQNVGTTIRGVTSNISTQLKNTTQSIGTSVRNNTVSSAVSQQAKKISEPVREKINNFSINEKLGYNSLLPFRGPMVTLLKKRGVSVSTKDPISKIVNLFHDNIVSPKQSFEYSRYNNLVEGGGDQTSEGDSGGNNVDWATVLKICAAVLSWCKNIWDKKQDEREAENAAKIQATIEGANQELIDRIKVQTSLPSDISDFADSTLNTVSGEGSKTATGNLFKLVVFVFIAWGLYKLLK